MCSFLTEDAAFYTLCYIYTTSEWEWFMDTALCYTSSSSGSTKWFICDVLTQNMT